MPLVVLADLDASAADAVTTHELATTESTTHSKATLTPGRPLFEYTQSSCTPTGSAQFSVS